MKKLLSTLAMVLLAFACALNYCLFVFPGKFAPAGVDGVCTMIGDVLDINMGYFALLLNIPLIICALLGLLFTRRYFSTHCRWRGSGNAVFYHNQT